jgi:O-antigen biosynthesis protein
MFVSGTIRSAREIKAIELSLADTEFSSDVCRRRGGEAVRFWAELPGVRAAPGSLPLEVRAGFGDGTVASVDAGRVEVEEEPAPVEAPQGSGGDLIAICLASFDPDPGLLRGQISSIRAQSDRNWICVISDDASQSERRSEIEALVADDPRFVLSVSERRRGFYLNFERALRLAPREARFIALCDQDDVWYPDKLKTLRRAIGDAPLAHSDARLTDAEGAVLAHSLWSDRRPNTASLVSVLVANSLPGASALIRADIARRALPFPRVPGWSFHDRWLPAVALSAGPIVSVKRSLYDYVQHRGAVLAGRGGAGPEPPASSEELTQSLTARWRGRFFYSSVPLRMYALALLNRDAGSGRAKRRALSRLATATTPTALGLSLRSLRPLLGRNETSGLEWVAASGLLWRSLARLRSRRCDTDPPPVNLWDLAPPRWGRRRARR